MASFRLSALIFVVLVFSLAFQCLAQGNRTSTLVVDAGYAGRQISEYFFGVFFEEINHAGAGGLWAELVNNRGFEAGGSVMPSGIAPWSVLGDESTIRVTTEATSCFAHNKIAVKLDIICASSEDCPRGVGLSNPGFWGMNIEEGKLYKVIFYVRSLGSIDLTVSFVGSDGKKLASDDISASEERVSKWTKMETILEAKASNVNSSLTITSTKRGVIWLDQISAMPMDTHMGHGFRKDLYKKIADLKPRFFRFPGGCYVEGNYLRNAFRWKDTIGSWEKRPGHFNDMWGYWTDDGFGYLEFLQLAEDLNAAPVWVFNAGISHHDEINTTDIGPFVQEALDGIEFARGPTTSRWGRVRAGLGHPRPFDLRMVAIGNENCGFYNYRGNYLKFHDAIKRYYPDMKIISNCDATFAPLDHPADLFDFHIYSTSKDLFSKYNKFDSLNRTGAKAFVSEYAVWKEDAAAGSFLSALGEAGFLMGLEKNSDVVEMVSYAPLLVNTNDRTWMPNAIVFDSHRSYAIPSYWLQQLFSESSGATYLNSKLEAPSSVLASTIVWKNKEDHKSYLRIKVVNFDNSSVSLDITINGLGSNEKFSGITKTFLASSNVRDENSFDHPKKIVLQQSPLENAGSNMKVTFPPNSITSFDLPK